MPRGAFYVQRRPNVPRSPKALSQGAGQDTYTQDGAFRILRTSRLAFPADLTPAQITANTNDYDPAGGDVAMVWRIRSDAARNITGIRAPNEAARGSVLILRNVGSFTITLVDASASSAASNRFAFPDGNLDVAALDGIILAYDLTSSRWFVLGDPVGIDVALGGTPALVLSTSNAAGVAATFVRTDDQVAAFDTTVPVTQASADAADTGSASVAARRDHRHGMPTIGGALVLAIQTFTASDTYTPTAGMDYCIVEIVGGGGGGGGANNGASTANGGGGGAGEYARRMLTAAQVGGSQTVTIGAAGAAGAATGGNGGAGGTTSLGTLLSAGGGSGGLGDSTGVIKAGGTGGTGGASADFQAPGESGGNSCLGATNVRFSGIGGSSYFGGGGKSIVAVDAAGNAGTGKGSGGSGAAEDDATGQAGGAGTAGYMIITEFV